MKFIIFIYLFILVKYSTAELDTSLRKRCVQELLKDRHPFASSHELFERFTLILILKTSHVSGKTRETVCF